jgi:hypothetical protein
MHPSNMPPTESRGKKLSYTNDDYACSRGLPETLNVPQLVKKFSAFYKTRRFITAFTQAPASSP